MELNYIVESLVGRREKKERKEQIIIIFLKTRDAK
jgi:hypothetical protein